MLLSTCCSEAEEATSFKDDKVDESRMIWTSASFCRSGLSSEGLCPSEKSATPARTKSNLDIRKHWDEDMKALDVMDFSNEKERTANFSDAWDISVEESDFCTTHRSAPLNLFNHIL